MRYEYIKKVIKRVQYSRKLLLGNCGECPPRSGGWRVSRRRGRISFYLAAYMLGLVCHIGDSGVAGNQLRSSCMPDFLAALVLFVPCINRFLGPFMIFWRSHPRRGLVYVYFISFGCRGSYHDISAFRVGLLGSLVLPRTEY